MEGYKKKPVLIEVFALLYLLNPIGNLLFLWFLYSKMPITEIISRLAFMVASGHVMAILIIILWISAIPLAIGLYKVRLWAWYYFLVHSICTFVLSMFGGGFDHFRLSYATLINAIFLVPIGFFISKEIRVPYFNPRVRWWEQSTRFLHDVKVKISGRATTTYDFSDTGAFISDENAASLSIGETLPVEIDLDKTLINCYADVRWINLKRGKYPVGYGIKFEKVTTKDTAAMRQYIQTIIRAGKEESR